MAEQEKKQLTPEQRIRKLGKRLEATVTQRDRVAQITMGLVLREARPELAALSGNELLKKAAEVAKDPTRPQPIADRVSAAIKEKLAFFTDQMIIEQQIVQAEMHLANIKEQLTGNPYTRSILRRAEQEVGKLRDRRQQMQKPVKRSVAEDARSAEPVIEESAPAAPIVVPQAEEVVEPHVEESVAEQAAQPAVVDATPARVDEPAAPAAADLVVAPAVPVASDATQPAEGEVAPVEQPAEGEAIVEAAEVVRPTVFTLFRDTQRVELTDPLQIQYMYALQSGSSLTRLQLSQAIYRDDNHLKEVDQDLIALSRALRSQRGVELASFTASVTHERIVRLARRRDIREGSDNRFASTLLPDKKIFEGGKRVTELVEELVWLYNQDPNAFIRDELILAMYGELTNSTANTLNSLLSTVDLSKYGWKIVGEYSDPKRKRAMHYGIRPILKEEVVEDSAKGDEVLRPAPVVRRSQPSEPVAVDPRGAELLAQMQGEELVGEGAAEKQLVEDTPVVLGAPAAAPQAEVAAGITRAEYNLIIPDIEIALIGLVLRKVSYNTEIVFNNGRARHLVAFRDSYLNSLAEVMAPYLDALDKDMAGLEMNKDSYIARRAKDAIVNLFLGIDKENSDDEIEAFVRVQPAVFQPVLREIITMNSELPGQILYGFLSKMAEEPSAKKSPEVWIPDTVFLPRVTPQPVLLEDDELLNVTPSQPDVLKRDADIDAKLKEYYDWIAETKLGKMLNAGKSVTSRDIWDAMKPHAGNLTPHAIKDLVDSNLIQPTSKNSSGHNQYNMREVLKILYINYRQRPDRITFEKKHFRELDALIEKLVKEKEEERKQAVEQQPQDSSVPRRNGSNKR